MADSSIHGVRSMKILSFLEALLYLNCLVIQTTIMLRSLLSFGSKNNKDYLFATVDPKEDGPDCQKDCADCTINYPSKLKIDSSTPLYGHIKQFNTHVLVATGKSDWAERVHNENGSLMEAFDASSAKSRHGVCLGVFAARTIGGWLFD